MSIFIEKVNKFSVGNLKEFKGAVLKKIETVLITIELSDGTMFVLDLNEILDLEPILAEENSYETTNFVKVLIGKNNAIRLDKKREAQRSIRKEELIKSLTKSREESVKIKKSSVKIFNDGGGVGSGNFRNKEGEIITNFHVIDGHSPNSLIALQMDTMPSAFLIGGIPRRLVKKKESLSELETLLERFVMGNNGDPERVISLYAKIIGFDSQGYIDFAFLKLTPASLSFAQRIFDGELPCLKENFKYEPSVSEEIVSVGFAGGFWGYRKGIVVRNFFLYLLKIFKIKLFLSVVFSPSYPKDFFTEEGSCSPLYNLLLLSDGQAHGSSGGPLINGKNEVVGINCKGFKSIKFSCTDDYIDSLSHDVMAFGLTGHDLWLGLKRISAFQKSDENYPNDVICLANMKDLLNLETTPVSLSELSPCQSLPGFGKISGLLITNVSEKSVFHELGFEKGDIIYEIDGKKLDRFGLIDLKEADVNPELFYYFLKIKEINNYINISFLRFNKARNQWEDHSGERYFLRDRRVNDNLLCVARYDDPENSIFKSLKHFGLDFSGCY